MSFSLNFSHVSFMELMNGCSDTIWIYVIVFINDILAYSNTTEVSFEVFSQEIERKEVICKVIKM